MADAAQSIAEETSSIPEKMESDEALSIPETLASEKETSGGSNREREDEEEIKGESAKRERGDEEEINDELAKKQKVDDESTKEAEVEMKEKEEEVEGEEEKPASAKLGPKEFGSGEEMFNYFFKFLHYWPPNLDVNKYEHMVLLELLKRGHAEPDKKIGEGIQAFQVRYHPMWKSRCFFLLRIDGSSDDFSFRKCVDHILPLPENMKVPASGGNNGKKFGGHNKGGGRGGRGGRGGGGRGRGGFRK